MAIAISGKKMNRTKINLILDVALALTFVVELEERFTGLRNHELLGLAFGTALLVHILLHWSWIASISKTFFRKLLHESRLNYIFNLTLFVDVLVVVVTGILISRTLGLSFGVEDRSWQRIHILSAELSLLLVGLHIAMHWKWIASYAKKYFFSFKLPFRKAPVSSPLVSTHRTTASSEV